MIKYSPKIPEEILKFSSLKENQILLVKGAPGAGKTTFALKCLKILANPGCGIYYTAKITTEKIYSRYPWIKDTLTPENIVDATKTPQVLPKPPGGGDVKS